MWGRRSGKTTAIVSALVRACLDHSATESLFLSLTQDQAKDLIWKPLQDFDKDYALGLQFNHASLTATFPNGSKICVDGVKRKDDCERFRGFKYKVVAIDEAGSFGDHLAYLIHDVLVPALFDLSGTLYLLGTPNEYCTGYFYERTQHLSASNRFQQQGQWVGWFATVLDNERFPLWAGKKNWREIAALEWSGLQSSEQEDKFLREFAARWIRPNSTLVIPFDDARNIFTELPPGEVECVIGIDPGFNDPFAIVVGAIIGRTIYVVEAYQETKLDTEQQAQLTQHYASQYSPIDIVMDPAPGKPLIARLGNHYGIPVRPADKTNKDASIQVLAEWFKQGRIKIAAHLTEAISELKTLQWRQKGNKREIFGKDHIFDALHYLHGSVLELTTSDEPKQKQYKEPEVDPYEQQLIEEMNREERERQYLY